MSLLSHISGDELAIGDSLVGDSLMREVADATEAHAELAGAIEVEWGPEVYSYGRREFGFRDPDRYMVIITEPTDDPTTLGPVVAEMIANARPNSGMNGEPGGPPQPQGGN